MNPLDDPERTSPARISLRALSGSRSASEDVPEDAGLVAHLEQILRTASVEHLWALHVRKMAEYGFDRLLYGLTHFLNGVADTDLDDVLILSNFDQEFLDGFFGRGHYRNGPITRWAAENDGVCSWRWTEELAARGELSEAERRAVAYNRSMGLVAGYSISFRGLSSRSKGAIGLCARAGLDQDAVDAIWLEHGRQILLINRIMHLRMTNLPFALDRRALTPRQREVLERVSEGMTTQEIASRMGVSVTTVEKHLRLAREALGVETTTQAVLKASFHNQIFRIDR